MKEKIQDLDVKMKFHSAKGGAARPLPRKQPEASSCLMQNGFEMGIHQCFYTGFPLKSHLAWQIEAQRGSRGADEGRIPDASSR